MLDFERLDVYRCSLDLAARGLGFIRRVPSGHTELSDQLRRAIVSIPLNIAEGSGKATMRDRARFHAIARGSAMESAAIIDLLCMQSLIAPDEAAEAKALCVRIVSMLSKMTR